MIDTYIFFIKGSDYSRKSFNLYKSVDKECLKWKEILSGEFFYASRLNVIVAAQKQASSGQQFIYYSVDAGESWQKYELLKVESRQTIRGVIYDENIDRFILIAASKRGWRLIQVGIDVNESNICQQESFKCNNEMRCIDRNQLCDGINSCGDFSDEICPAESINEDLSADDENEELLCIFSNVCLNRNQLLLVLAALFCLITLSSISLFCWIARRRRATSDRSIAGFFKVHLHNAKAKLNEIRDGSFIHKRTSIISITKHLDTQ